MGRREKRKASEYTPPGWTCKECGTAIYPTAPSLCYECMFTKEEPAMSALPKIQPVEDKTFSDRARKAGWFKDPNIPSTYYLVNLICNMLDDQDEVNMDNELRLEILKELDDLLTERIEPSSLIFNAIVGTRVDDMTARYKLT
jgi:hypothetical protein